MLSPLRDKVAFPEISLDGDHLRLHPLYLPLELQVYQSQLSVVSSHLIKQFVYVVVRYPAPHHLRDGVGVRLPKWSKERVDLLHVLKVDGLVFGKLISQKVYHSLSSEVELNSLFSFGLTPAQALQIQSIDIFFGCFDDPKALFILLNRLVEIRHFSIVLLACLLNHSILHLLQVPQILVSDDPSSHELAKLRPV